MGSDWIYADGAFVGIVIHFERCFPLVVRRFQSTQLETYLESEEECSDDDEEVQQDLRPSFSATVAKAWKEYITPHVPTGESVPILHYGFSDLPGLYEKDLNITYSKVYFGFPVHLILEGNVASCRYVFPPNFGTLVADFLAQYAGNKRPRVESPPPSYTISFHTLVK